MSENTDMPSLLAAVAAAAATADGATYQLAAVAAADAIRRAMAALPAPECGPADMEPVDDIDGALYADWSADVTVGPVTRTVQGWMHCGWLQPGASCDLDGSGLANWRASQPGGWSACDGDGAFHGVPMARICGAGVTLHCAEGRRGAKGITVAELLGLGEQDQQVIEEHLVDVIGDAVDALADGITSAIDGCRRGVKEPDADAVWEALGAGAAVRDCDAVRVGYWGGTWLVAVEYQDGKHAAYQAHEGWEDMVGREGARRMIAEVRAELEA